MKTTTYRDKLNKCYEYYCKTCRLAGETPVTFASYSTIITEKQLDEMIRLYSL